MRKINIAVIILLIMAMFAIVPSASALQDLKITNDNLATLQSLTYNYPRSTVWYSYGEAGLEPLLLKYDYGNRLNTYGGSKTAVYVGTKKAIKVRDGQCVLFVNAIADRNYKVASDWRRGRQVMDIEHFGDMNPGAIIATFSSPTVYSGHVAVFDSWHWTYAGNYQWKIDGFYVWDQNYVVPLLVGRHLIKQTGSGVGDADNYYVVQGP